MVSLNLAPLGKATLQPFPLQEYKQLNLEELKSDSEQTCLLSRQANVILDSSQWDSQDKEKICEVKIIFVRG